MTRIKDYKKYYVYQRPNRQWHYPDTLPRLRNHFSSLVFGFIIGLCILLPTLRNFNNLYVYMDMLLLLFICHTLQRLIWFVDELICHLVSRYNNSYSQLFQRLISIPTSAKILLGLTIIAEVATLPYRSISSDWLNSDPWWTMPLFIISTFLVNHLLNMNTTTIHLSQWISKNNNGMDYGAGMANSYYHGFLKLILNRCNDADHNLQEAMEIYENTEHVRFMHYKWFILIPKSMTCHDNLGDVSEGMMEMAKTLTKKYITRAGVQKRDYHNSVYKIRYDQPSYLVTEYATPLKTFKEVVMSAGRHHESYMALQNDIVHQFYVTLRQILIDNRHPEVDLVYYDDVDENNQPVNVAKMLLCRIQQIEDKEKRSRRE